jgi:hypothetical protein
LPYGNDLLADRFRKYCSWRRNEATSANADAQQHVGEKH